MRQILTLFLFLVIGITGVQAQATTINGQLTDRETGEPLIGATILVQETGQGTVTDFDGNYSLTAEVGQTLEISYVGYEPMEIVVGEGAVYSVGLTTSAQTLEEIVVVGYGTQKSKDLTSSISVVNADDIAKTPTGNAMQGLQGKVAGVQVVSSGAPGQDPTVRIRGVGSYPGSNNEAPLYVVDGMFFDNIGFLNPSEIASISILKDASAAAIYGVRAANGVVLIETKSGAYNKKAQITYDGYAGTQVPTNVLQVANAEQFTTMAEESGSVPDMQFIQNAMQRFGRSRVNPNVPAVNTDWYSEIMRPASIMNHSVNISGGSEDASYSVSGSYFKQDGILKMKNYEERFSLRTKVEFKATDWFKIGGNMLLVDGQGYNPEFGAWNSAYFAVPILPVYDEANEVAWPVKLANARYLGYRGGQNPFSLLLFNDNRLEQSRTVINFYGDIEIIPNRLTFRSSYSNNTLSHVHRNTDLPYFLGEGFERIDAAVSKRSENWTDKIWDNTLTYSNSFGNHNLQVMGGTSFRDESFHELNARAIEPGTVEGNSFPVDRENSWYIDALLDRPENSFNDNGVHQYGMSYFSRVSYNYKHKYLVYGTFRADGSSKYQEKWGYFPTVGVGWVLSEEDFWDVPALDYVKFRASWGKLGNDKIAASDGAVTTSVISTAINDMLVSGTKTSLAFSFLRWEVVEELNFGLSTLLASDRLSFDVDYYTRDTENAVIPVQIPAVGGTILRNVGVIRNSGFEFAANWTDALSPKLSYNIGLNFSTLQNEVIDLFGQPHIDGGMAEFRQRSIVGEPVLAFYGREVAGVYQNQAQIDADPVAVENGLVPGDFIYKDINGDGTINDDDRVVLGSYLPKVMFGGNIGVGYAGFDLAVSFYGQSGNKILNRKRGEIIWTQDTNMDADLAKNRWHGEGTTNSYPSAAGIRKGWNQRMSDYFVEDGDFFRVQNIQLGYTINKGTLGTHFPQTRIVLTADRPITVFDYNGFSPEVSDGIDTRTYPIPAVYTGGLSITF